MLCFKIKHSKVLPKNTYISLFTYTLFTFTLIKCIRRNRTIKSESATPAFNEYSVFVTITGTFNI